MPCLSDPAFHLVVIATRHHEHADQVVRSLAAGKHVFVEKPLAITWEELDRVVSGLLGARLTAPLLMVGFNRRFSPALQMLKERLAGRRSPLMIQYRLNAGYIPLDHWVHGAQGGGRNIGEACHMYDVFRFLAGAPVRSVEASAIDPGELPYARNDNFAATHWLRGRHGREPASTLRSVRRPVSARSTSPCSATARRSSSTTSRS